MYLLCRSKNIRQQEVEQRPELVQVILQWSAGQQQAVLSAQLAHCGGELTGLVLQAVGLVDDQIVPGDLCEGGLLQVDHFVCGDHHVPVSFRGVHAGRLEHVLHDVFSFFLGAVEPEYSRNMVKTPYMAEEDVKGNVGGYDVIYNSVYIVELH